MTIVDFRKKVEKTERMVWRCDCGNCSFIIYSNGNLECAQCGVSAHDCTEHYQAVRRWTRKKTTEED